MVDRAKLAAPLFAQAAAFVVVLVIGGFAGHAPKPPAPAPGTATPSARTPAPVTREAGPKLTVRVVQQNADGVSVSGSEVKVLQNGSLTSVASGPLNQALQFAANVPAGQYQVCINPPIGWGSAVRSTAVLGGWICTATDVGASPASVTFRLALQAPQAGQ
jgi:hypothetical protein